MSLQPQMIWEVPEETEKVARAAFPKGNIYIRMRDKLGVFFRDDQFDASWHNERLVAGAVAALVAWRTRNISITLVAGMLVFWLIVALTG